jgi:hypothetical protein
MDSTAVYLVPSGQSGHLYKVVNIVPEGSELLLPSSFSTREQVIEEAKRQGFAIEAPDGKDGGRGIYLYFYRPYRA